jgi:hypothetical protein
MTQDEIIEMARQAGLMADGEMWFSPTYGSGDVHISHLETFAKLVAEKEREACANICDSFQERDVGMQPAECAGAIRARGQALAQPKQDSNCKKCKDGCPACDARKL